MTSPPMSLVCHFPVIKFLIEESKCECCSLVGLLTRTYPGKGEGIRKGGIEMWGGGGSVVRKIYCSVHTIVMNFSYRIVSPHIFILRERLLAMQEESTRNRITKYNLETATTSSCIASCLN
jgi:hypothetical protein